MRYAHETIFALYRELKARGHDGRSSQLLAEAAQLITGDFPAAVAPAQELHKRWSEQSVLDREGANKTLLELAVAVEQAEPLILNLIERQQQIARELQAELGEAG